MAANARAAIGPDIGRVCAVQVKRETAARGGREGMRVQTLWNLLEVVLPVTAEAVADVTRAHAHTQPSQGAHVAGRDFLIAISSVGINGT